jgi:ABC-type Na+ efflux pump permease subunit
MSEINQGNQVAEAINAKKRDGTSGLAVAGFVVGLVAIIGSWIPFLNVFSAVLAVIALGLSIPGLIITTKRAKGGKGLAIAGLVFGIVTIILVVVMYSGASTISDNDTTDSASPKESTTSEEPKEASKEEVVVIVSANDIIQEFEDNELAADEKYKGKTLEVSGIVTKVDTDLLNDTKYILNMNGGGDWDILTVSCYDIDKDALLKLSTGDEVTVIGTCRDGGDLGVTMRKCSLK